MINATALNQSQMSPRRQAANGNNTKSQESSQPITTADEKQKTHRKPKKHLTKIQEGNNAVRKRQQQNIRMITKSKNITFNERLANEGFQPIEYLDQRTLIFRQSPPDLQAVLKGQITFEMNEIHFFDTVLREQDQIELAVMRQFQVPISQFFSGISQNIVLFGGCNSGKTRVAIGNLKEAGMIPLILKEILQIMANNKDNENKNNQPIQYSTNTDKLTMSMFSYANPQIHLSESQQKLQGSQFYDVFIPHSTPLNIFYDSFGKPYLPGLSEIPLKDPAQAFRTLKAGFLNLQKNEQETELGKSNLRNVSFVFEIKFHHTEKTKLGVDQKSISTLRICKLSEITGKINQQQQQFSMLASLKEQFITMNSQSPRKGNKKPPQLIQLLHYNSSLFPHPLLEYLHESLFYSSITHLIGCISPLVSKKLDTLTVIQILEESKLIKTAPIVNYLPEEQQENMCLAESINKLEGYVSEWLMEFKEHLQLEQESSMEVSSHSNRFAIVSQVLNGLLSSIKVLLDLFVSVKELSQGLNKCYEESLLKMEKAYNSAISAADIKEFYFANLQQNHVDALMDHHLFQSRKITKLLENLYEKKICIMDVEEELEEALKLQDLRNCRSSELLNSDLSRFVGVSKQTNIVFKIIQEKEAVDRLNGQETLEQMKVLFQLIFQLKELTESERENKQKELSSNSKMIHNQQFAKHPQHNKISSARAVIEILRKKKHKQLEEIDMSPIGKLPIITLQKQNQQQQEQSLVLPVQIQSKQSISNSQISLSKYSKNNLSQDNLSWQELPSSNQKEKQLSIQNKFPDQTPQKEIPLNRKESANFSSSSSDDEEDDNTINDPGDNKWKEDLWKKQFEDKWRRPTNQINENKRKIYPSSVRSCDSLRNHDRIFYVNHKKIDVRKSLNDDNSIWNAMSSIPQTEFICNNIEQLRVMMRQDSPRTTMNIKNRQKQTNIAMQSHEKNVGQNERRSLPSFQNLERQHSGNDSVADKSSITPGKGSHQDITQDNNNKGIINEKVVDENGNQDSIVTKFQRIKQDKWPLKIDYFLQSTSSRNDRKSKLSIVKTRYPAPCSLLKHQGFSQSQDQLNIEQSILSRRVVTEQQLEDDNSPCQYSSDRNVMKFSGLKDWMFKQKIVNTLKKDSSGLDEKNQVEISRINQSMNALVKQQQQQQQQTSQQKQQQNIFQSSIAGSINVIKYSSGLTDFTQQKISQLTPIKTSPRKNSSNDTKIDQSPLKQKKILLSDSNNNKNNDSTKNNMISSSERSSSFRARKISQKYLNDRTDLITSLVLSGRNNISVDGCEREHTKGDKELNKFDYQQLAKKLESQSENLQARIQQLQLDQINSKLQTDGVKKMIRLDSYQDMEKQMEYRINEAVFPSFASVINQNQLVDQKIKSKKQNNQQQHGVQDSNQNDILPQDQQNKESQNNSNNIQNTEQFTDSHIESIVQHIPKIQKLNVLGQNQDKQQQYFQEKRKILQNQQSQDLHLNQSVNYPSVVSLIQQPDGSLEQYKTPRIHQVTSKRASSINLQDARQFQKQIDGIQLQDSPFIKNQQKQILERDSSSTKRVNDSIMESSNKNALQSQKNLHLNQNIIQNLTKSPILKQTKSLVNSDVLHFKIPNLQDSLLHRQQFTKFFVKEAEKQPVQNV